MWCSKKYKPVYLLKAILGSHTALSKIWQRQPVITIFKFFSRTRDLVELFHHCLVSPIASDPSLYHVHKIDCWHCKPSMQLLRHLLPITGPCSTLPYGPESNSLKLAEVTNAVKRRMFLVFAYWCLKAVVWYWDWYGIEVVTV